MFLTSVSQKLFFDEFLIEIEESLPKLPEGAQRALFDPYAEKRHVWPYLLVLFLLMAALVWAWYTGYFE